MDRFDKELKELEKSQLKKADKALYNAYKDALKDIKAETSRMIKNFDSLTEAQQLKLIARDATLQREVERITNELHDKVNGTVRSYARESMKHSYTSTFYKLEGKNSLAIPFIMIDEKTIKQAVNAPVAGKRLSQRLYRNRTRMASQAQTQITRGLIAGDGYAKIAGRLNVLTEANYYQSYRIARTEGKRVRSLGALEAYDEAERLGIELEKMWVSTLDGSTRDTHQMLDGQTVGIKEEFEINGMRAKAPGLFGVASEDIHCRCTVVEQLKDYPPKFRRNNESGEVIQYKNYREWEREKGQIDLPSTKTTRQSDKLKTELELKQLKNVFDEANFISYKKMLEDNSNQHIKKLYAKHGDEPSKVTLINTAGGSHYDPDKNSLVVRVLSKGEVEGGRNAYSTIAHEYGHFFDANVKSSVTKHTELEKLREIVPKSLLPKNNISASDEFISAVRKDREKLNKIGFDNLSKALKDFDASSGVQDAIDGMFMRTQNRMKWGHGESYYNRKYNKIKKYGKILNEDYDAKLLKIYGELGYNVSKKSDIKLLIRDYETSSEAWANIISAITTEDKELEYIKKYLPNSHAAALKILKGIK